MKAYSLESIEKVKTIRYLVFELDISTRHVHLSILPNQIYMI